MKKEAVLKFLKRRKILLGIVGVLLSLLMQLPFVSEHYIVSVKYCDNASEELNCEVVSDNLFDAIDNLITGSLEAAIETPEPTPTIEVSDPTPTIEILPEETPE